MRVLFRCGHEGRVKETQPPLCHCGERGIARCFAPPPRFVGKATGPLVATKDLDPITVQIGESPLKLRQETSDGDG